MKTHPLILILFGVMILNSCQPKKESKNNSKPTKVEKKSKLLAYGIDLSHHQNDEIDSIIKNKDSLDFIVCKATEGITYTDPKFLKNWKTIKKHTFLRGAYHFYRCNDDPLKQAVFFLKTISDIDATDIPPIVDFEEGGIDKSQSLEKIQSNLRIFITEIEKESKRKPIIYTDVNTANKYLNDSYFSNYPLWIASYDGKKHPNLPIAWKNKDWLIWQRFSTYKLNNLDNDFDIFNGNLLELKKFIKNSHY